MSSISTYMTLDDHEIENNFPASYRWLDRLANKQVNALRAYNIYQASHSPVFDSVLTPDRDSSVAYIKGVSDHSEPEFYHYTMDKGIASFFVMDTRTERGKKSAGNMVSDSQEESLLAWLGTQNRTKVKFVVSSVPMLPDMAANNDVWSGYAAQRNRILNYIFKEGIKNVTFLSGDVHASYACTLTSTEYPGLAVNALVCSGLHWPEAFLFSSLKMQEHQLKTTSNISGLDGFKVRKRGKFYNKSAYSLVTVTSKEIRFEVFGRANNEKKFGTRFALVE